MQRLAKTLLLLAASCTAQPAPLTPEQGVCLGAAEATYWARVEACKGSVEGDCSTDHLIDQQKAEARKCLD